MFRTLPYIALFATALLSQVLFFDNLALSVQLSPLVYILFILLLPIETPQYLMLALGVTTGFVMDATMGTDGLNSIATIFIAFFRAPIIRVLFGKERATQRGVPSEMLFGASDFLRYICVIVLLHHAIFFGFETLSLSRFYTLLWRYALSCSVTILFVWLMARLYNLNNILK